MRQAWRRPRAVLRRALLGSDLHGIDPRLLVDAGLDGADRGHAEAVQRRIRLVAQGVAPGPFG